MYMHFPHVVILNYKMFFVGSRYATVTLGAPPNSRISKMILDYPFGGLLVQVISNVLMSIVITYIAMGIFGTKLNGLVQLLSRLLWVIFPPTRLTIECKVCHSHMYALLCVMLE